MFNSNQNKMQGGAEMHDLQFIIVYDKLSKPAAKALYNKVSDKYKCVVWDKKHYLQEEPRLTNKNKRLFFCDDLIEENLQDPTIKPNEIMPQVFFKKQGPTAGITISKDLINDLVMKPQKEWASYLAQLAGIKVGLALLSSLILSSIPYFEAIIFWKILTKQNKAKLRTYFYAIDLIIKKGELERFINN